MADDGDGATSVGLVTDEPPVPLSRPPSDPDPIPDYGRDGSEGSSFLPVGDEGRGRDARPPTASTARDRELAVLLSLCGGAGVGDSIGGGAVGRRGWEDVRRWLRGHSLEGKLGQAYLSRRWHEAQTRRGRHRSRQLYSLGLWGDDQHLSAESQYLSGRADAESSSPLEIDIVRMLVTASPSTLRLPDNFGWLPLHYACSNEASLRVLALLVEAYPESRARVDKRGRTPLHFCLGQADRPAGEDEVSLLSGAGDAMQGGGASDMADENGMLSMTPRTKQPLHYACAYGATDGALRVLVDLSPRTVMADDNRGRTPLHLALGNAVRPSSPLAVSLLVGRHPAVVDSIDLEGNLPIHLLATSAQSISSADGEGAGAGENDKANKRDNCRECLRFYLGASPCASTDLITALQSLPEFLKKGAVLNPMVQRVLNRKISKAFPTAVVLLDFAFYILVIVFFQLSVIGYLRETENSLALLVPLYSAAIYFTLREVVQALSLASLGLFKTWLWDKQNWLDLVYILLIFFWTATMNAGVYRDGGVMSIDFLKVGTALSLAIFWVMVLLFLQSIIVGFAVFVGGVVYVLKRLRSFLFSLAIILFMFAQIFFTLYRGDQEVCPSGSGYLNADSYSEFPVVWGTCQADVVGGSQRLEMLSKSVEDSGLQDGGGEWDTTDADSFLNSSFCAEKVVGVNCEPVNDRPFCNLWTSFLKIFTMLLGEAENQYFADYPVATIMFALFMFGCVVVLANVLIAIVTVVAMQNKFHSRNKCLLCFLKALVFWSNRLDFVAEMDVISSSLHISRRARRESTLLAANHEDESGLGELWRRFMYLSEEDVNNDHGVCSLEYLVYILLRVFSTAFIIPMWTIAGVLTFGLLWPPQIREKLMTSQISNRKEKFKAEVNSVQRGEHLEGRCGSLDGRSTL
ncbi:hypothetical protein THAOC_21769 [Thalassiosira oceanica]|uniref:Ion transport domain-containing protein n=1 Tax=Thalassiosira oceanica TaxID=159749 RepID=K0SHZ4_THAOC|nr:hypothetical protein THAOC_21769 [Thalassiosira oceanica]|eukprot:EJK58127.1 hypothetical protein THAOC_21769 [Thalassiosira oceanica]